MTNISDKNIYRATYIYLALPLMIFLCAWLNVFCALLCVSLFGFAFYKAFPKTQDTDVFVINGKMLLIAVILAIVWCFLAGIGYFYYQSWDYHFRNAVFHDLINYNWPVFYDKARTPLVYYMGFYLFPAALGKFIGLFISGTSTTFFIANIFLFIYAVVGVSLIFLLFAHSVRVKNIKQFFCCSLLFILFSGLDIIGYLFFQNGIQPFDYHLDWWASFIQFSSFSTGMFWAFNQFIPVALAILLIYNEKDIKNFGFILPCMLFLAPYPTFTIGMFMLIYALKCLVQISDKKYFLSYEVFSIQNIIGVFWLLPVVLLFLITNSGGIDRLNYVFQFMSFSQFLIFLLLEFLLYVLILFPSYKRDVFFITTCIMLLFIPLIRLDQQNNFCMRASIPALIMLAVFTVQFLLERFHQKNFGFGTFAVIWLLILGSVTPMMEFYRGIHYTLESGRLNLVQDEIRTLNQAYVRMPVFGWSANHQFSAFNYKHDIFWQYMARKY